METHGTEQYHNFEDWIVFAYGNALLERGSEEVEKRVKYTGVIANCVILDNVIELNATQCPCQRICLEACAL
jgi:hypothetical protein